MALKIGIIGNGGISNAHMDGYKALGDRVEVVACCDINFEKAKSYAEKYGVKGNLVAGANIAGFEKVAEAMLAQGIAY